MTMKKTTRLTFDLCYLNTQKGKNRMTDRNCATLEAKCCQEMCGRQNLAISSSSVLCWIYSAHARWLSSDVWEQASLPLRIKRPVC